MGSFDTVHGGWRCGQTKALGKGNGQLLPGDKVSLIPAPRNDAEFQTYLAGNAVVRPEHDFVLEMNEDGYLVVQGGVYVEWADQPTTGLPVFDSLGTQLAQPSPQLVRATPDEHARTCPACQAVQAGTLTAYREQRKAEGEARTAANAERKAQRARSETRAV